MITPDCNAEAARSCQWLALGDLQVMPKRIKRLVCGRGRQVSDARRR
jgi:hypothetical protein